MKKHALLILALVAFSAHSLAQCIDITLNDNTGVTYKVSDIKSIDFFDEGPQGSLYGRWYLGYTYNGTTASQIKGRENIVFRGNQMVWNKTNGSNTYNITYNDDMWSFVGIEEGKITKYTYTIAVREPRLLVLKRSSYYYYLYPDLATAETAEREILPNHTPLTDVNKIISTYGSGRSNNPTNPMGNHIASRARRATAEEVAWLEDPTTYPAKMCGFTRWSAKVVTLYPYTNPVPADVNQHSIGDCCLCSVLTSMAYNAPDFIKNIITKESSTVFAVKMYDPYGDPITVRVDNKILCTDGGNIAQMTGKNDKVTWATILEKAMFKWEAVYKCNSANGDDVGGIGTENACPQYTGCGNSFAIDRNKLFTHEMELVVKWAIENGQISIGGFGVGGLQCGTEESVTGHAFCLMLTSYPDKYLWSMRNPWGQSSTSVHVDGKLEIPNDHTVVKTIDLRICEPGAMKPFLREEKGPYTPPSYIRRASDTSVAQEILKKCGVRRFLDYVDEGEELIPSGFAD